MDDKGKSRWIWSFATSPCVGLVARRRELRLGARLVPLCGIPEYLDEQASKESGCFFLSSGTATDVLIHALESIVEREFRSECISMSGRVLCSAVSSRRLEL